MNFEHFSLDPRIGAGPSGTDTNLDTNSGIVSRLTWNGSAWDKLDVVRGLPRSKRDHASNGMFLDQGTGGFVIENNFIYNIDRSPLRFHKGWENVIRKNVLAVREGVELPLQLLGVAARERRARGCRSRRDIPCRWMRTRLRFPEQCRRAG